MLKSLRQQRLRQRWTVEIPTTEPTVDERGFGFFAGWELVGPCATYVACRPRWTLDFDNAVLFVDERSAKHTLAAVQTVWPELSAVVHTIATDR